MKNSFAVKDRVFVITGATGYLGQQMVKDLIAEGASVAVLSQTLTKAEKFCNSLNNPRAKAFAVNIAQTDSVKNCFDKVLKDFGAIDVLVNNAYFGVTKSFEDTLDDDWDVALDGSVKSVHRCVLAALPALKKSAVGRVINIASMYGLVCPDPSIYSESKKMNPLSYGVGKAAIVHYTKYAAMKLAPENITVNCVSYGPFPNPDKVNDDIFKQKVAAKTLLGRIGELKDVTAPIYFLAMPASAYITGQNIIVDGGWTTW
ncbi:MAG: SDR family oxidoreductase [Gammaproteobacteria bacterium]|nr:SDR family oxidoreductase [Gammaproteobacteria bacterium]